MDAVAPPSDVENFLERRTKTLDRYISIISFLGRVDLFSCPSGTEDQQLVLPQRLRYLHTIE